MKDRYGRIKLSDEMREILFEAYDYAYEEGKRFLQREFVFPSDLEIILDFICMFKNIKEIKRYLLS